MCVGYGVVHTVTGVLWVLTCVLCGARSAFKPRRTLIFGPNTVNMIRIIIDRDLNRPPRRSCVTRRRASPAAMLHCRMHSRNQASQLVDDVACHIAAGTCQPLPGATQPWQSFCSQFCTITQSRHAVEMNSKS
jgi:riboflavin biosynthesis pyrimidine reductase